MAKKRTAKKTAKAPVPAEFTVAQCQWCGMQWKHFGSDSPKHFCGKVCASHIEIKPEGATDGTEEEDPGE